MVLGHLVRRPRRRSSAPETQCHCALNLDALILPHISGLSGSSRPLDWPIPACITHEILASLPRRYHDSPWSPVFSTDLDGFSLNQLLRRAEGVTGACVLLAAVVPRASARHHQSPASGAPPPPGTPALAQRPPGLMSDETVIGAFLSDPPGVGHGLHKFFGSDETFVFTFPARDDADSPTTGSTTAPHCGRRTSHWAENNNREFILASHACIGVGGGKDGAAIYLGADLQFGSSSLHCETFSCGPLLSGDAHGLRHVDFAVHRLWLFEIADDYLPLTRVPLEMLTGSRSQPISRNSSFDGGSPTTSPEKGQTKPAALDVEDYVTPLCSAQGHHRCPYIAEALHRHGTDARGA
jgi:hypothetical protein